jgi:hypothetical protein
MLGCCWRSAADIIVKRCSRWWREASDSQAAKIGPKGIKTCPNKNIYKDMLIRINMMEGNICHPFGCEDLTLAASTVELHHCFPWWLMTLHFWDSRNKNWWSQNRMKPFHDPKYV